MGHRNPQGLFFDKKKNIVFSTEHGPAGGDEININFSQVKKLKILVGLYLLTVSIIKRVVLHTTLVMRE